MGVLSALTHMLTFPQSLSSLERFGKVCGTVLYGLVWYGKVVRPWPCLLLLLSVKPEGHWPWPRPDPFFEASNVCMYGFVRFGMVCYGVLQSGLLW